MSKPIQRAGLIAAVALSFNLLGCDSKLDDAEVVGAIKGMIDEQLKIPVSEVKCPKGVEIRINKVFECQATFKAGGELPVSVKITDEAGSIQMETKYKVLDPKDMRGEGMECGDTIVVLKPGTVVNCTAQGIKLVGTVNDKQEIDFE